MTLCINPHCQQPNNPDTGKVCQCGSKLLLLDRYRPISILGKGGFGKTFLAIDEHKPSKPRCAVKQLSFVGYEQLVKKAVDLFEQEAVVLESLGNHPQIPTLLAYFTHEERLYIVQEFVEGVTLEQELLQGAYSEFRIRQLLHSILPVLKFVHEQNILHRDIKPPNIIIRASDGKPVLIDFGVAKVLQSSSFISQATALGTLHYAAPEQFRGSVFQSSDLYSLGVTCISLITGVFSVEKMYDGANLGWCWRKFLPATNIISNGLGEILDKLIEFQPIQRYQSAQEVLQALSLLPSVNTNLPPTQINYQIPVTQPSSASIPVTIKSSASQTSKIEIYYIKLELLLQSQKWKEADLETWKLLCMALNKPPETKITSNEINLIHCEQLHKIDQLWIEASNGKFGFSVQNRIFESVGKDYVLFCQHVQWQSYNSTLFHQSLKFTSKAPPGHFPSRIWAENDKYWRYLNIIASKLSQCSVTII
ncbi:serine/threonine protein kinase [Calothrix sp. NIES-4071]|nr:serine/threonine protein kinase [Calothrix sp. NIES-4071]BAZ60275.1 serine/threonine protein kinase [Calothrix sp. NIES-4105]